MLALDLGWAVKFRNLRRTERLLASSIKVEARKARDEALEASFDQFLYATLGKEAVATGVDDRQQSVNVGSPETRSHSASESFHWRKTARVLRSFLRQGSLTWDIETSCFNYSSTIGHSTASVQLPRLLLPPDNISPEDYINLISDEKGRTLLGNTLMVFLSADSAALGLWQGDVLRKHKVLTGYTVRKGRGGNQAKYLRSGGPGRSPGGRMRVREAGRLFGAAAEKLCSWKEDIEGCSQAFMSGDVRAFNSLYGGDPPPPIDRRDPRWQRIGISIRKPRLDDLKHAFKVLSYGRICHEEQQMPANEHPE